ncbi:MAG: uroporphyrinogen decarboxylase family protein [Candidatus Bathyarchaeia archaeon]
MDNKEVVLRAIYFEDPPRLPYSVSLHPDLMTKLTRHFKNKMPKMSDVLVLEPSSFTEGKPPAKTQDGRWVDEWGVLRNPRVPGTIDWFENIPIARYEDLDNYQFPDPEAPWRFEFFEKALKELGGNYCLFGGIGWLLWERAWILRGMKNLILDMYKNPAFVDKLMDRIMEYDIKLAKQVVEREIDVFYVGDDYGSSLGPLISPHLWRRFIKPRLRQILRVPLRKGLPVAMHSDGNIEAIVPDLIEVGVRVLNPVTPPEMDPFKLRQLYTDNLCIWGAARTYDILPFGKPKDVEDDVRRAVKGLWMRGGLIYHARLETPETPLENIMAVLNTVSNIELP